MISLFILSNRFFYVMPITLCYCMYYKLFSLFKSPEALKYQVGKIMVCIGFFINKIKYILPLYES